MFKAPMMMVICEALAAVGLLSYVLFPRNVDLGLRVSSELTVGLPLRWCVSVALIATAGLIGIGSLVKAYWVLAHSPYLR